MKRVAGALILVVAAVWAQSAMAKPPILSIYAARQITVEDERWQASKLVEGERSYELWPECVDRGLYRVSCIAEVTGRETEYSLEARATYHYQQCRWTVKVRSTGRYPHYAFKRRGLRCREWDSDSPFDG